MIQLQKRLLLQLRGRKEKDGNLSSVKLNVVSRIFKLAQIWLISVYMNNSLMEENFPASNNQLQKCWDTLTKNRPFLLQIAASHRSLRYNTHQLPPLHSKLFLHVLSMGLNCKQLWQRDEEGSQTQVSSLLATGWSLGVLQQMEVELASILRTTSCVTFGCWHIGWSFP